MRTNGMIIDTATFTKLERQRMEADWRRAWDSCSHAAQAGDYAAAECWHHKATLLGSQLAATDRVLSERHQALACVS
jgi:hypothetical protein